MGVEMHTLGRRYGRLAMGLTPSNLRALRHLAEAAGGMGGQNGAKGITFPAMRKLHKLGLVTLKTELVRYTAGRPFGEPGAGRSRTGISWGVTITDAGRAALAEA